MQRSGSELSHAIGRATPAHGDRRAAPPWLVSEGGLAALAFVQIALGAAALAAIGGRSLVTLEAHRVALALTAIAAVGLSYAAFAFRIWVQRRAR